MGSFDSYYPPLKEISGVRKFLCQVFMACPDPVRLSTFMLCHRDINRGEGPQIKYAFEVFVFNTNLICLTFMYKIDIEGFKKFQQIIKLLPVGFEFTTLTNNGLEVRA